MIKQERVSVEAMYDDRPGNFTTCDSEIGGVPWRQKSDANTRVACIASPACSRSELVDHERFPTPKICLV
jgi:hypothetical protein